LPDKGFILKNYNFKYAYKSLERIFKNKLTVKTTYHEFNRQFLSSLENDTLKEFKDDLYKLVNIYPHNMMAWRFIAKTCAQLENVEEAIRAYHNVLEIFDIEKAGRSAPRMLKEIISYINNQSGSYDVLGNLTKKSLRGLFLEVRKKAEDVLESLQSKKKPNFQKKSINQIDLNNNPLIIQAKKLYSEDFERSVEKYREFENEYGYPGPQFSIWIINSARGAHDDDTIIDYAVKGLNHPDLTSQENKTILIMSLPAFRRKEEWELMRDYISQYLDTNPNPEKFILRSFLECYLKLGDYDGVKSAANTLLTLYPDSKAVKRLRNELIDHVEPDPSQIIEPDPSQIIEPDPSQFVDPDPSQIIEPDPTQIVEPDPTIIFQQQAEEQLDKALEQQAIDHLEKQAEDLLPEYLERLADEQNHLTGYPDEDGHTYKILHEENVEHDPTEVKIIKLGYYKRHLERSKKLKEYLSEEKIDLELEDELSEELEIALKEDRAYEISPMLRADVVKHSFQDETILAQDGKVKVDDANRLLEKANRRLSELVDDDTDYFRLHGRFLEAAKAYYELDQHDYEPVLYLRAIGTYAALRAGGFYNQFKTEILKKGSKEKIQRLKDSASSYYYEALRLRLDIEDLPGKKYKFRKQVAEDVVLNHLRLNAIFISYANGQKIKWNSFRKDYYQTAEMLGEVKGGVKLLAILLLKVGSANPENFNNVFSSQSPPFLKNHPINFLAENRDRVFGRMGEIIGVDYKKDLPVTKNLENFLTETNNRYKSIEDAFENIKELEFRTSTTSIDALMANWMKLFNNPDEIWFSPTDIEIAKKISIILDVFSEYSDCPKEKRFSIINHVKAEFSMILNQITDNPTHTGVVHFIDIFDKWQIAVNEIQQLQAPERPNLRISIDPECILLNEEAGLGELNIEIINEGASLAFKPECRLIIYHYEDKDKKMVDEIEPFEIKELKPGMSDTLLIPFNLLHLRLLKGKPLSASVSVYCMHITEKITKTEDYTLNIQDTTIGFDIDDIKFEIDEVIKDDLFKGRGELIDQLTTHYLSHQRKQTYMVYGMTRHGKTSLTHHLSESLLDSGNMGTRNHGELKIIPFYDDYMWNFGEAALEHSARELWRYLVRDTIIQGIENYVKKGTISKDILNDPTFKKINDYNIERYKARFLTNICSLLIDYGYFAFIVVDEFSYFKPMVEKELINEGFLQALRNLTIGKQLCSFIFSGTFESQEILEDYAITSQLANIKPLKIGSIDPDSAEDLIQYLGKTLNFTPKAVKAIQRLSNNIPYFIQILCFNCAIYASFKKKNIVGGPDVERVVKYLTGEKIDPETNTLYEIKELGNETFIRTQYIADEKFLNAVISTIASESIQNDSIRQKPDDLSLSTLITKWGDYGKSKEYPAGILGHFQIKQMSAIKLLLERGIIKEQKIKDDTFYELGVDLFRRWWNVHFPKLDFELMKLSDYIRRNP
jgi:hypothetical protein